MTNSIRKLEKKIQKGENTASASIDAYGLLLNHY
jgi:hypothetical protein